MFPCTAALIFDPEESVHARAVVLRQNGERRLALSRWFLDNTSELCSCHLLLSSVRSFVELFSDAIHESTRARRA